MKEKNYVLREAELKDYDDYYLIRSEKNNLYWTGYEHPPDYQLFSQWFADRLKDPSRDIYLLFVNKECAGSLHIDYYDDEIFIGYSVKEKFAGKGYGTILVREAVNLSEKAKEGKNGIKYIRAWINSLNIASVKVVEKNGFSATQIKEVRKRFGNEELYLQYALKI